jgi:GDPmannose 4,6-dehydratase|tara:strand:+ start:1329 stop:2495 length:1167 start_codon:yes stop_codon:yes gene_type:complete
MKKAIVFGVTGQDGSYLTDLLILKGYQVIGVARRSSVDTTERIGDQLKHPNFLLVEGDITDGFCVSDIINKHEPDEVYNLAAQSHVGTSFKQPTLTWDVTAAGCLNILEAIRACPRREQIKFYQASSSEMFGRNYSVAEADPSVGDILVGASSTLKYQDEDTPFIPQSPYAIAKLAAHHLVRNYRDSYEIFGCCGILFNHESERRGENFVTRKITKWIARFLAWEKNTSTEIPCDYRFTIEEEDIGMPRERQFMDAIATPRFPKLRLGNLDAQRDWGHAKDYVRAMWLMLQEDIPEDYVVATGRTRSVRDFLDIAFERVGISDWEDFVFIDPEFFRPSEVDYLLGISEKAKSQLGWKPEISFKQLVHGMIDGDLNEELLRPELQEVQN